MRSALMAKRAGQFRSGDLPLGMLSHFKRTQHQRLVSRGRRWAIFAILAAPAFNACRDKASPYAPLAVGAPVPAFAASTLDGQEISLASLKGKPVVLNIWATWCGPCRREMPLLDSLSRESAARGIRVIGVSIDDEGAGADIRAFLTEYGISFTVLHDPNSTVTAIFRTRGVPETFLIDSEGRLARRWIGGVDGPASDIRKAVEEVR